MGLNQRFPRVVGRENVSPHEVRDQGGMNGI